MNVMEEDQKGNGGGRRRVEVYQEENFEGADLTRTVHIGWGVTLGVCLLRCLSKCWWAPTRQPATSIHPCSFKCRCCNDLLMLWHERCDTGATEDERQEYWGTSKLYIPLNCIADG